MGVVSKQATDPGKRKAALGELGSGNSIPSPEKGKKRKEESESHDPAVEFGARSVTWLATYPYQWLWESDTCLIGQGVGVPGSRTVGKRHSIAIRPIIAVAELGWTNGKDDMHGSSAGPSWSFPGRV
ncbi:hypothetical protein BO79DRAFT_228990 [Aspergillus costaricaensis CBS 115574]|uniref:Uncharacterized protein n=1 Tax=Aspergillus costaricaensis CBS 115574 TaxID=1448317 RepID=A0ACD1IDL3_9EURO|nr:hypothetical protein BO79DRAFT_228990 [Aspergillus costaricaensis CBS 115574]RAK88456.1 hypothetical protein BO79DRAFT_228990 [Aspergillus costaricaensis CBS 115574]